MIKISVEREDQGVGKLPRETVLAQGSPCIRKGFLKPVQLLCGKAKCIVKRTVGCVVATVNNSILNHDITSRKLLYEAHKRVLVCPYKNFLF